MTDEILEIDLNGINDFKKSYADCVILSHDKKVLLQYRPPEWYSNPDGYNLFGGFIEKGETTTEALLRELKEELGADVSPQEVRFIGAVSEGFTGHEEVVHVHFWHDVNNLITGCYEAESRCFDDVDHALMVPKLMDYARWALLKCKNKGLLD